MKTIIATLVLLVASLASADVVVHSEIGGSLVASPGAIRGYDRDGAPRWKLDGLASPTEGAMSQDGRLAAFVDALNDEVAIVELERGVVERHRVGDTPIAPLFVGPDFYLLCRDARSLTRITSRGVTSATTGPDPAFLLHAGNRLYVYSRLDGSLEELSPDLRLQRTMRVDPHASDFEIDGAFAYFVYPRAHRVVVASLDDLAVVDEISIGAVPIDLAIDRSPAAMRARIIAVADPSSKRVWQTSRRESASAAFARGFVRGLLGLGLGRRSDSIPTGVDRVWASRGKRFGYDSASRTLYRLNGDGAEAIASDVGPTEFAIGERGGVVWDGGRLVRFH